MEERGEYEVKLLQSPLDGLAEPSDAVWVQEVPETCRPAGL